MITLGMVIGMMIEVPRKDPNWTQSLGVLLRKMAEVSQSRMHEGERVRSR